MTTVATISASAPSGAAGFTGPARSSETSDQFAIELGKTTQQVRERGNTAEPRPNPPKGSADNAASTPVENATGNEVASGTEATQQGEQVEPQQLLDSVIAGLDNGESTDLNHDQSTDLQSLVSTPVVAIAPRMVLPAEQLVAMDETATAGTCPAESSCVVTGDLGCGCERRRSAHRFCRPACHYACRNPWRRNRIKCFANCYTRTVGQPRQFDFGFHHPDVRHSGSCHSVKRESRNFYSGHHRSGHFDAKQLDSRNLDPRNLDSGHRHSRQPQCATLRSSEPNGAASTLDRHPGRHPGRIRIATTANSDSNFASR